MSKRILIDAFYQGESRLVLCNGNVVEEFDYQDGAKKFTKSNVYLAKVDRVEPSLQAAFVDYGGERHGFLPFAEVHPYYYQIPVTDKEELFTFMKSLRDKAEKKQGGGAIDDTGECAQDAKDGEQQEQQVFASVLSREFYKRYKICEVIKKDQLILVQIEKEGRGNKGAFLTTYLSLAGRYCVIMPNTNKLGGISKRIDNFAERKRLKELLDEFKGKEPNATAIIRTAGAYKSKVDIKRDFSYLLRLWDDIKSHALSSTAPIFIHEEGDLVKKAIRDLYTNDVEEIVVSGHEAYEATREFMKLLLPKHVDKVKEYKGNIPIFSKYQVEEQLSTLYQNVVSLASGGYLVINQTEALVAIDVNSGKSTGERSIENTALKTNLEAITEIVQQLKLRDLSGLIVVDFIDMLEPGNRTIVENTMRNALVSDRARTQITKISEFGLLEMTRQRMRNSITEATTIPCITCGGRGRVRVIPATATVVLRAIQTELNKIPSDMLLEVSASKEAVLHLLNEEKSRLLELEILFKTKIKLYVDNRAGYDGFFIESVKVNVKKGHEALSNMETAPYRSAQCEDTSSDGGDYFHSKINKKHHQASQKSIVEVGKRNKLRRRSRYIRPIEGSKENSRENQEPEKMVVEHVKEKSEVVHEEKKKLSILQTILRKIIK
ncbi:ribonuclease E [Alphaproteobacteria bacterium]